METWGKKVTQGVVSRWLREVAAWIDAGNILPNVEEETATKPTATDPSRLDLGAREERRYLGLAQLRGESVDRPDLDTSAEHRNPS
jgi:hypothetical protein